MALVVFGMGPVGLLGQSEGGDSIHGVVINSITREPVARALVESGDEHLATLTNSEGRFEFTLPKAEQTSGQAEGSGNNGPISGSSSHPHYYVAYSFRARKPGFLEAWLPITTGKNADVTIELTPEALIMGTVKLPSSEPPDPINVQLFRREVRNGRARYVQGGMSRSRSDGSFRFADLRAGTYKLLTNELLDRDPLTFDPAGPLYGYPPVYYQNAPDFEAGTTIEVSAGQTVTVNLSLVKQQYYRVKLPVSALGGVPIENGVTVNVYAPGHRGPGFTLGYNHPDHTIVGMLPSGTYTIEAMAFGRDGESAAGLQTITVKGGAVEGPGISMAPSAGIPVNVKEEFTGDDPMGRASWNIRGRNVQVKGPRRYLNVMLEPAEEFGMQRSYGMNEPTTGAADEPLMISGPAAGSYRARVTSSRGYAASVRSGNLDLLHQPLVVGVGGVAAPIEITMRDDWGEVGGKVEGVGGAQLQGAAEASGGIALTGRATPIYFVPTRDSSGQFAQTFAQRDGSFDDPQLAPGAYRVLAFDRDQTELEYHDPEAMRAYDSKGPVVTVAAGQKVQVTLQLISTEGASH